MDLRFDKGLHTNSEAATQPDGTYRDANNMRYSGNALRSELGNVLTNVPSTITIWGDCAIADETIVLGQFNGKSIIGSLDKDGTWTQLIYRVGVDILGINSPTQVEGRKNWAGERLIYFSTDLGARRINLDATIPVDDSDFDKITSLFLEFDLPQTNYGGETSGGELLSGTYQVAARLVTDSGAETSFGIASNPIPIVQASLTSTRTSVVGNPPQTTTTKALSINVTNVDPSFKYIQLGVLTYIGLANTPVITVTDKILINGRTNVSYTYRGASDDAGTITIEEFIISGVSYSSGKYFTQKDGTLIIGSPEEAEMPPIDWHRVAAGMRGKFTIKKIPYTETLNFSGNAYDRTTGVVVQDIKEISTSPMDGTYKDPITCELYKGYRRDEVYAFTMTPVFKSGVYGPTVHIPAYHNVATAAYNQGPTRDDGGYLGTYISEEKYPDNTYPGLSSTDGLRLHKMPTSVVQQTVGGNVETNDFFIRVLGVQFTGLELDASELQYADQIAGIIIGRVNRKGNETQLAQGIVRNNNDVRYNNDSTKTRNTLLGDGHVQWTLDVNDGGTSSQCTMYNTPDPTDFTFVSPDIIHGRHNPDEATHIKQQAVFKCNPYAMDGRYDVTYFEGRTDFAPHKSYFKNITGESSQAIDQTEIELEGLKVVQGPFGVPNACAEDGGKENTSIIREAVAMEMASSDGFVWMKTLGGVSLPYVKDYTYLYSIYSRAGSGDDRDYLQWTQPSTTRPNFILHSLTRQNTKQYGALESMTSMFAHYQDWASIVGGLTSFYNGDTFINKYGLTTNDEGYYPYASADGEGSDTFNKSGYIKPGGISGIIYMWIESDNNYDYRHYIQPTSYNANNVDQSSGSVPFYPAYKTLLSGETPFGILSMHAENWTRPGYASQYNNQYSAQPTFKPFTITPKEDVERRASLVNRVLYSAQSVQGEKTDAYQIFLGNNFYDVPQMFGDLTDVYVNKELFASTAEVQWKLFFNTLATQATSAGEVVLGTGGAFNRPAVPMTDVDGGYGGNAHWTHAVNTVFGRIFVDTLQGKVFLATDKLDHITKVLKDTERNFIRSLAVDAIRLGSEPLHERAFIRLGETTYSYNFERGLLVGKHTIKPRWMFSHGPYMYTNNLDLGEGTKGTFKHSVGLVGEFYGNVQESYVTLVGNQERDSSKEFQNMQLITKLNPLEGMIIPVPKGPYDNRSLPFDTFNKYQVWNYERNTGLITIVPKTSAFQVAGIMEALSSKVRDKFSISISRDVVVDPELDVEDVSNHAQIPGDKDLVEWLPKIKGNFVKVKLITDNTKGVTYLLNASLGIVENIR